MEMVKSWARATLVHAITWLNPQPNEGISRLKEWWVALVAPIAVISVAAGLMWQPGFFWYSIAAIEISALFLCVEGWRASSGCKTWLRLCSLSVGLTIGILFVAVCFRSFPLQVDFSALPNPSFKDGVTFDGITWRSWEKEADVILQNKKGEDYLNAEIFLMTNGFVEDVAVSGGVNTCIANIEPGGGSRIATVLSEKIGSMRVLGPVVRVRCDKISPDNPIMITLAVKPDSKFSNSDNIVWEAAQGSYVAGNIARHFFIRKCLFAAHCFGPSDLWLKNYLH